jgi:putative PIG3 family NAD(P)H quinone oxidoreductase
MRAVMAPEPGGLDALKLVEVPTPEPAAGEILVRVEAAGVNRADLLQRQGFYPPPPGTTDILGLECAGTVAALGPDVSGLAVGDPVCALLSGGGYSEYVTVPAGQLAPIPAGLDGVQAAAIMETACTVWSNLVMVGRLTAGETVLVHGGSSGIGTMAIQVAKALGARVVTTVGSPEKAAAVSELGADVVINYREQDFADVMSGSAIQADVILDIMGAKYLGQNVAALATNGRLVIIGLQGGLKAELNLGQLLAKRASVTATSLRARPAAEKAEIVAATRARVFPLIESGTVRPIVHATFDLADSAGAHRVLEESSHIGKIVLISRPSQ